jgi:hypothetical protein
MFFKIVVYNDENNTVINQEVLEAKDLADAIESYLDNQGISEDSVKVDGLVIYMEDVDGDSSPGQVVFEPWDEEEVQKTFVQLAENLNWKSPEDLTRVMRFRRIR